MSSEIIITLYVRFGLDATQIATTKPLHKKFENNEKIAIEWNNQYVREIAVDTMSHM